MSSRKSLLNPPGGTVAPGSYGGASTIPVVVVDAFGKVIGISTIAVSVAGLVDFKDSVRAATTAPLTLASDFENGDSIDGVTLATGDRILIKDQASGSANGIYVVAASGAPTRATDFDADAEVTGGCIIPVSEGTANGNKAFMLTTNDAITVGSTALVFSALGTNIAAGSNTQVQYNSSGAFAGSSSFTWDDSTKTLTINNAGGTSFLDVNGSSNAGAVRLQGGDHPGSGGGVILPFVGGSQSSGPGLWWANNDYSQTVGIWLAGGFNFQGYNSSNSSVKIRKGTGTSSDGAVMITLDPDTPAVTFGEALNLVVGTTTGTKIGTVGGGSGQKLAFFGSTPIVQPVLATGAGATADNIITVLQNLGLVRQS